MRRLLLPGLALAAGTAAVIAGVLAVPVSSMTATQAGETVMAPKFEVDPAFPKPLANHWVLGMTIGVAVDEEDHVWILHRPPTISASEAGAAQDPPHGTCCVSAPPIMEFNQQGDLLRSWGGPNKDYDWPASAHGLFVDANRIVWLGANASDDAQVLKFTKDGKFLAQFGKRGQSKGSNDTENFGAPAKIVVDTKTKEAFIADGYRNKRVAVIDTESGVMKRYWGAYGNKPDDANLGTYDPAVPPARQFRGPVHCAQLSNDGLVYACDRQSNRVQVFNRDGSFVKEVFIATKTRGDGAIWDIAFSPDPAQEYMYVADGKNERIYIVRRSTLEVLSDFGGGGRQPGQWFGLHSLAVDSRGNLYTTETYEGRRLQKFVFRGVQKVPVHQGVVWPAQPSGR